MSVCYEIACQDCKKSLWIGQSGSNKGPLGFYIYTTEPEYSGFVRFLMDHRGHNLEFDDDQTLCYKEYKRINLETRYQEGDTAKLVDGTTLPDMFNGGDVALEAGWTGEIVSVHDDPELYEVEFELPNYQTATVLLKPEQIEVTVLQPVGDEAK